jgi:predicted unusual protein kinase regulating ubiquinone biosynthesis (AarF/ABC1/UbiB family)
LQDLCAALEELHDRAPQHALRATRETVLRALGAPLESLFLTFDTVPIASGSIAQVCPPPHPPPPPPGPAVCVLGVGGWVGR